MAALFVLIADAGLGWGTLNTKRNQHRAK